MSVDEFDGRQKKAKNASADEKLPFWKVTPEKDIPKALKEECEFRLEEKAKYDLYHKTYSGAVQHAADVAKKQGYEVDQDSWDSEISSGQRKPSAGKDSSVKRFKLIKGGKEQRKQLHIQNFMEWISGKYELNMYIEELKTGKTFKNFITEGRPALDPDYVPPRTETDAMKAKLLSTQKRLYSAKDIESLARKYKVKLDGPPVGGKSWNGDWENSIKKWSKFIL